MGLKWPFKGFLGVKKKIPIFYFLCRKIVDNVYCYRAIISQKLARVPREPRPIERLKQSDFSTPPKVEMVGLFL